MSEERWRCKIDLDRERRRTLNRLRSVLLTIPRRAWYYQSAKKPAVGWSTVLILNQEKLISATEFRVNEGIRVAEVRLIGPDGSNVGVVPMRQALQIARDAELDLVEVSPNANPPVCRVIDYGKFIYERAKPRGRRPRSKSRKSACAPKRTKRIVVLRWTMPAAGYCRDTRFV